MTQLEQQMIDELVVAQGFTNDLATNLTAKGVAASNTEGLDTLVPKVLQIESGGGTTKTDYELWQEGFGVNWDSVVANAPMTNTQRILHIYTKVELLKMLSTFPTTAEIYTYNGSVYRQIIMDTNQRLAFISADYITNTFDNLQYVCVVYGNVVWGTAAFETWLPVVYGNSKAVNYGVADVNVNLLKTATGNYYPTLRGVDVNTLSIINLAGGLEHITYQNISQPLTFRYDGLRNCEIRSLKSLCDTLPSGLIYNTSNNFYEVSVKITDEALADWFYNTWLYTIYATGTLFYYQVFNYVRKFKVNSAMPLKASASSPYIRGIPSCDYIEGTFTEDQTSAFPGFHGFNSSYMRNLKNFPMWTVLEGATTGCLLPATSAGASANFRFYSTQLERSNFAIFDELGNIDTSDPTKSFVANLPVLSGSIVQSIKIDDTTFKNQFTENERSQIVSVITVDKKWDLIW